MSRVQQKTTDIIFVVGLISGSIWCSAQTYRALTSTNGVSLAQYLAFFVSFVLGLTLAVESNKKTPGRIIKQQIIANALWSIGSVILIGVVFFHGGYHWSSADTRLALITITGLIAVCVWASGTSKPITDPAIRGLLMICLKALPQFLIVGKIIAEGGNGYHWSAILMGNTSILTRLIPLFISVKSEGMNRAKWWLLAQDSLNELSWSLVSVVWLLK